MKKLIVIAVILSALLVACKKEKKVSVTGFWEGTYTVVGGSSQRYFALLYRDNATARMFIGTAASTDTNSVPISKLESSYENRTDSVVSEFIVPDGFFRVAGKLNNTANAIQGNLEAKGNNGILVYTTPFAVTKQ